MQRVIRYILRLWPSSIVDAPVQVLALDPTDMRYVLDLGDGQVLRL